MQQQKKVICYSEGFFFLQIWQCLAESAIYSSDRESCFKWFAKVSILIIYRMEYMCVKIRIIS